MIRDLTRRRDQARRFTAQGFKAFDRYERTGNPQFLNVAITALRSAEANTPPGHPSHAERLANLAEALFARSERIGTATDADGAIGALSRALDLTPSGHPYRAALLSNLGVAYQGRCELTGSATDLDLAIQAGQQALDLTPPDDTSRAARLSYLGTALRQRYALTSYLADLDTAVEVGREAVDLLPSSHPSLAMCLSNLATTLTARYEMTGNGGDLNAAILAALRASDLKPASDLDLAGCLSILAHVLRTRFKLAGDMADLEVAVSVGQRAVALTPHDHVSRAWYLTDTGTSLLVRFNRTGDERDLHAAVAASRHAVGLVPPEHPNRSAYLSNLGNALLSRFWHTGNIADLNAIVEVSRRAVELTPDGHVCLSLYLSNLAIGLCTRARRVQSVMDTGAAVDAIERAVRLSPSGDPNRPGYLSSLCDALLQRFSLTKDIADVHAAIEAGRQAVILSSPGHPDRVPYLINLASALIARFEQMGQAGDLDAAVEAGQEALDLTLPGHPGQAICLANLASSLRARYENAGDAADLDVVIDHLGQASALIPPGDPILTSYLFDLAGALNVRYELTKDERDLDTAICCWRRAYSMPAGNPGVRLAAAQNLGVTATDSGRIRDGADGFAQAVALLPEVAWHGLDRVSRERQLAHSHGLAANAAACAIAAGRPRRAVELLEQGRSVLWSQALALRGDLSRLADVAPRLAERLSTIRSGLDAPLDGSSLSRAGMQRNERAVDQRMRLAREWDDLIQQVRSVTGFEDYLQAPRLERLLPAAESGPVVIVNVSPWGCDALIVTSTGVQVESLPGLTSGAVTVYARRYLDGLRQMETTVQGAGTSTAPVSYEQIFTVITAWLWDHIARPVLTALGINGPPEAGSPWPRLWWCPTGALNLLPLHAAGHHTAGGRARHQSVLDRVVSSYTPTLRALLDAREEPGVKSPADFAAASRMLVVGLADTPGQMPLPSVDRDLRLLAGLFPERHTILDSRTATWDAVRAQLPRHRWAHFSCHADQDFDDPSRAGILLYDRKLNIADISEERYHGDFAFLSACRTAAGGTAVLDEAITLASALHYTGYRHVIAAQWSIRDKTAADVTEGVYTRLTSAGAFEPDRAAEALHTTIKGLRDAGKPLSQWVPFIHTGP